MVYLIPQRREFTEREEKLLCRLYGAELKEGGVAFYLSDKTDWGFPQQLVQDGLLVQEPWSTGRRIQGYQFSLSGRGRKCAEVLLAA